MQKYKIPLSLHVMKGFILLSLVFFIFSGCKLEEAKPLRHKRIVICSDTYCKADSLLAKKIGNEAKVKVELWYMPREEMETWILKNRYNAPFDALIISSEAFRTKLKDSNVLSPITGESTFKDIQRQFYNTHKKWLTLCHDPLIIGNKKDSTEACYAINWNKVKSDSIPLYFKVKKNSSFFLTRLKNSKRFSNYPLTQDPNSSPYFLIQLSELIDQKKKPACYSYVLENKKFLTLSTSISIYKFSRNRDATNQIVALFSKHRYQFAANKNQLSPFKDIKPNWEISRLTIH